jgi:hypothetical protein
MEKGNQLHSSEHFIRMKKRLNRPMKNSSADVQTSIGILQSIYYNYFLTLAPPKKLLSIFTTKSGRSSGIQCPDKGTLTPVTF